MRILAGLVSLIATTALSAQTAHFVGPRPDLTKISVRRDVVFRAVAPAELKLDLYRPLGSEVVPVVIFANIGNPAMKSFPGYVGWGEAVAGSGLAAVNYDASPEAASADFDALLSFLRDHAGEYHIDPTRLVIWSGSSNVQLGLPVAMDAKRRDIRGAVVYYGAADVPSIRLDVPLFYARAGRDAPGLNMRIDALAARALKENAPWTVVNVASGMHAFDAFDDDVVARDTVIRTLEFMKAVTLPATSDAYLALAPEAANAAAFARGEWDIAIEGYQRRIASHPDDAEAYRRLGLSLSEKRRFAEALPLLERAYEMGRRGTRDTVVPAAVAAAGAGNGERAAYWLDLALATPFGGTAASYRTDPRFENVRDHPAFVAALDKYSR